MSLTDTEIKNAKAKEKHYKLYDADGLHLRVMPNGGKLWRFKFYFEKKEKLISFGTYPAISLKKARTRRDEARALLADGINPSEHRKAVQIAKEEDQSNSFEVIAREWLANKSAQWAESHRTNLLGRLELNIFPFIGKRPIAAITAPELLKVLRRAEDRGAGETAHRMLQNCGQIFRYGVATGRLVSDPSRDLKGALSPVQKKHLAAIVDPVEVAKLLRVIDGYHGSFVTKCALRLAPLFFVRPGELRHAEWAEINFELAEWNIPAERMKMKQPHLVPLSSQAIEILKELRDLTGSSRYLFPSARSFARPMSNNAILAALRTMGYSTEEMTGHGFRAMARTILDEVLGVRADFIEHQLAHAVRDPNGRAYNRTAHLGERKKMMQLWADYLVALRKNGANPRGDVIQIRERVA